MTQPVKLAGRRGIGRSKEGSATWLDAFTEDMAQPSEMEEEFFARRRALGKGVGLDAAGNLVYAENDATP